MPRARTSRATSSSALTRATAGRGEMCGGGSFTSSHPSPPPLPQVPKWRTSSCTRVWRPAPPREHPFLSPGGFRGASCSVCRVCGYGAFLALCWSVCACSLIPAGHPWVNRCVLAERSTMRACLVESCVAFRSRSRPVDRVLPVRCMCSDTCLCAATDIHVGQRP